MKDLDEPTGTQPRIRTKPRRHVTQSSSGVKPASLEELVELVEHALAKADALEFSTVGIDLCTALERLKAMDRPVFPVKPRKDV